MNTTNDHITQLTRTGERLAAATTSAVMILAKAIIEIDNMLDDGMSLSTRRAVERLAEDDNQPPPKSEGSTMTTWQLQLVSRCHKCEREISAHGRATMLRAGWDDPIFIWQGSGWLQTQLCPRHARWWTLRYWARRYQLRIGRLSGWLSPNYSACGRCRTNWDYIESHTTNVSRGSGCFALCEPCWVELTPIKRLPFYRQLFDEWVVAGCSDRNWNDYEQAVLSEGQSLEV